MKAEAIRARSGGEWTARADGWWRKVDLQQVPAVASAMKQGEARFAALTVRPDGTSLKLSWHWDVAGTLLSIATTIDPGEAIPSLVAFWPGADWAEREARDYYAVRFSGRESTPPLMLREGDRPGVQMTRKDGESS